MSTTTCRQAIDDARYALGALTAISDLMCPQCAGESLERVRPDYLYRLLVIVTEHTDALLAQAFELAPEANSTLGESR